MSKYSSISRSSSSESLVESSSHETPAVDEQSKSPSPPVMKTKTKKSDQRDAYKANSSSSATYTGKNHDIGKSFKTEIDTARELNAKKQKWAEFSKRIEPDGIFKSRGLMKEEIQDLVEWLKTNPKDKIIEHNLSCSSIGADDAEALAEALKTNTTITTLDLSLNRFGPEVAKALAEALKTNTTITTLVLHTNDFGSEGAKILADMLKTNKTITKLDHSWCDIGAEGAKDIVVAIVGNPNSKITMLDLGGNRIGTEAAKALAEALETNNTITSLHLAYNRIDNEGAKALAEALETNNTIISLDLAYNRIDNEGAISIVKALIANPNSKITMLNLIGNRIDDRGVKAIARALIANPNSKITDLYLGDNRTTSEGEKFIKMINHQCELNAQRAQIEDNISAALDLLTARPNPNDGNVTSVRDVNSVIAKNLFALDKAGKLNTAEVIKDPNSVINKYS